MLFIIRWVYAESKSEISNFIKNSDLGKEIPVKKQSIRLEKTHYLLFDGVEEFGDISEFVKFDLPKGTYTIETFDIGNQTLRIIIDRIEIVL